MHRSTPFVTLGLGLSLSFAGVALAHHHLSTTVPSARSQPSSVSPAACTDRDGDGYGDGCRAGPDCNDEDSSVHPFAVEQCNGRDDDCNALADDAPSCTVPKRRSDRVSIPAGSFDMGSSQGAADERPVHRVSSGAFVIDRYEVTNARYAECVKAGACSAPALVSSKLRAHYFDNPSFADYPVIFVAWSQADAFCRWDGGRLPTEAEWERSARGTNDGRTYPWGDSAPDCTKANMKGCVGDTDLVGRREEGASPYGVMDMAGNVWEWTADWYDTNYYANAQSQDPTGPQTGKLKVMRGGCWVSGASSLRTTCRKPELPDSWAPNVGFRCVHKATGGGR